MPFKYCIVYTKAHRYSTVVYICTSYQRKKNITGKKTRGNAKEKGKERTEERNVKKK